jgi:hypothetical protein
MLIRRSPFITHSPSLPQAIFPLGHDLLFYPDILLGNLRGLGIVNSLEFIVLIGALINICDLVSSQANHAQQKVACMLETAKLITICLIISSDQQIFQAISSKNDLVYHSLFRHVLPDRAGFSQAYGNVSSIELAVLRLAFDRLCGDLQKLWPNLYSTFCHSGSSEATKFQNRHASA